MITLKVPDMSCGHCAGVITKALKQLDPAAVVNFDMHNHLVQVDIAKPATTVIDTLSDAGYPATLTS